MNNGITKIRYLLALSNIKPDGEAKIRCSEALTRGSLKNKKREKTRHKEHPALKKLVVGILCAVLCVSVAAGVFLLVNRGKIPLPQPEQTDIPGDTAGLKPYDASMGELLQIVLLHKTLAFDYMNSALFNSSFDPSSQSEVVAYNSNWTTSYFDNIYDYHMAYDSSQKVSVLMRHIPFASDVRLVDNDRDMPNVAFPFPQVLEYGTDAETGFSYALVCSFYYDLSQATVSSITSYDLRVKQDGMYTDVGRYDLSEQKLYFKVGVTLPCVLWEPRNIEVPDSFFATQ